AERAKTERLRALRLAKEAADREAAGNTPPPAGRPKAAAKKKKRSPPLNAALVLQTELHAAIFEAAVCVAGRPGPELPSSLKGFHASPVDDHRLRAFRRAPVDLGFGVGIQNREDHRVPLTVVDDRLRRRSAALCPRAQGLERVDLAEINHLAGRNLRAVDCAHA